MKAFLTFLSLILVGIAITVVHGQNAPCGEPVYKPKIRRIVGGYAAEPGSWPWMVMLKENGRHECGGSILNEKFILTAAHCFVGNHSGIPSKWRVYAGKHHKLQNDTTETLHHVKKIILHDKFNKKTFLHDIALVELQEPIVFTDRVRPVCLPQSDAQKRSTPCYATGWGDTRGTGNENVLNQVALPIIIRQSLCRPNGWNSKSFLSGKTFCAGYRQGKMDGCSGDSGGPLNCEVNGKWYVQGIISRGRDCAQPGWPGIYTNIFWPLYKKWINSILRSTGSTKL